MIELPKDSSDPSVVGVGHHRICFIDPEDSHKCIKVIYSPSKHASEEVRREVAYYRRLQKSLKDWSGIPKYYGEVETNLGTGYVYDRIIDFDGKPSQTMQERYQDLKEPWQREEMTALVRRLEEYLTNNHIVTMSLKPFNILCHRISETEIEPVICDNIGTASFIPIELVCPWFARNREKRMIKKMIRQQCLFLNDRNM